MAEAISEVKAIEVKKVDFKRVVTLTMSEEEAKTLYHITRKIGGCYQGRRKHIESICSVLGELKFDTHYDDMNREDQIMFTK